MTGTNHQKMIMRPLHPNDVAKQAVLMNRIRDTIADSITVAGSVNRSDTQSGVFDTSATVRQPSQSDDFSFAR